VATRSALLAFFTPPRVHVALGLRRRRALGGWGGRSLGPGGGRRLGPGAWRRLGVGACRGGPPLRRQRHGEEDGRRRAQGGGADGLGRFWHGRSYAGNGSGDRCHVIRFPNRRLGPSASLVLQEALLF